MRLTAYLHVSERTGSPIKERLGFSPRRNSRPNAAIVWTSLRAARLNCFPGGRVVKVCITDKR